MLRLRRSTHHRHHIRVRIRRRLVSAGAIRIPAHSRVATAHLIRRCVKPTLIFFEERCRSLGLVLLPATADDADDDEFDADEEDKDDGGNPNRAILADKSSSSVSLSRFPKSDIPSPGKSIIPLSSSAELRHRVCRSFCFYPSLSRKASFSLFLSRLRERNVKRERQEATEMMRHTTTHARRDVRVLLCL